MNHTRGHSSAPTVDKVRFMCDPAYNEDIRAGVTPPPEPAPEVQQTITLYRRNHVAGTRHATRSAEPARRPRTARPRERREQRHTARSTSSGDSGDSDSDGPGEAGPHHLAEGVFA